MSTQPGDLLIGPEVHTLADTLAAVNAAYLPVYAALADLRRIFEDYFARCDAIFASLEPPA